MPIVRTDRVAKGADQAGRVPTTPSGTAARVDHARYRESWDRPAGALCRETASRRAGRARWRAFSAVLDDLRARLEAAEAKAGHLEVALGTNRRIGIAVGILMCRLQVTEDQALAVLRKHSQDHNVKLRDLAEEVIYTGTL
jgi:hypothetical protein